MANVVFIIMDDLAWGDLACHGNPHTRTPRLDELHAQSTRLARYYSGPLCSPARASIMTGRWHMRTRCIDTYVGRSMMDPDETTLAELLQQAGYATGLFGKWHLGDCFPMRPPDKGFGESLYHLGGGIGQPGDYLGNCYFDPVLHRDGKPEPSEGYCTDIFGDATCDFIDRHKDEPFFAYLATNCPHTPLEIADEWVQPYLEMGLPEKWAKVYGMVENIDVNVGKVMDKLEEVGVADDTIVIFTSDHGPCGGAAINGEHRWNAGLRGHKGTMYEGGVKTPGIIRWPRRWQAGRELTRITHAVDWLPTLLAACGVEPAGGLDIDGRDLTPLLDGTTREEDWPARDIFMQWHRGDVPVRNRNAAVIDQQYKWYRHHNDQPQLFDIEADPFEKQDLAAERPDIAATMQAKYDAWFDDVSSTRGEDNYDPPRIPIGHEAAPEVMLTRQDWRMMGEPDGWTDDDVGAWLIRVAQAKSYSIRFDFPRLEQGGSLIYRCGGDEREVTLQPGSDRLEIASDLSAGEATLETWVEHANGGRQGMRYVWVSA